MYTTFSDIQGTSIPKPGVSTSVALMNNMINENSGVQQVARWIAGKRWARRTWMRTAG